VEVYRSRGVTLLVDNGRVVRAVHSSSGRPGWSTPGGTFSVVRKELLSWSVPFQVLMPYASYFVGGIAFHGYSDVPAYPASHGCVRLSLPEAPFVYEFARPGTPVAVI
jgi:lipoprotein-anchoring transpeptidase ErfK/SrfK